MCSSSRGGGGEEGLGVVGGFGSVALIKLLAVFFGPNPTELHYLNGLARTDDDERWARRKAVPPPATHIKKTIWSLDLMWVGR